MAEETPVVLDKNFFNSKTMTIGGALTLLAWAADNMAFIQAMLPADIFRYIALYGPPLFMFLRYISTGTLSFQTPFKIPFIQPKQ